MEIAYLILAHNNPFQLKMLVDKLNYKNNSFVIHYDLKANQDEYRRLQEIFANYNNVFFTKRRIKCYWGDISLVDASIHCLNTAFENIGNFEYAVLISGQHFPIKGNDQIEAILSGAQKKNFITHFKIPSKEWANEGGGTDRIIYYHFNKHPRKRFAPKRLIKRIMFKVFKKLDIKRKPPIELDHFYGGSQWWCLTKDCCSYVLKYIKSNPEFYNFFKYVHIPDEMFFQTILLNSKYKSSIVNSNLTYIDWGNKPSPNPKTLNEDDYIKLKSTSELWARKIEINKSEKLLKLLSGEN